MTAAEIDGCRRCRSPVKLAASKRLAPCRNVSRPSYHSRLTLAAGMTPRRNLIWKDTIMKISAAFPSNYLKCADLGDQPRVVTVRTCVMEELGQGKDKEKKPVLYFEKGPKGLVLNVTNANTITKVYSDDTANWTGKPIELYPTQVEFRGDTVDAIRIRVPDEPAPAAAAAAPPPASGNDAAPMADDNLDEELNDEIPW
jgi:hypothetical protein